MILKDYEIIDFHTHPFGFGGENICSHRDNLGMTPEHIEQDMRDAGISYATTRPPTRSKISAARTTPCTKSGICSAISTSLV